MATKEVIQNYLKGINEGGWESFVADDIIFVGPGGQENGKDIYVQATSRFLQVVKSVELKKLIIDGDVACALTQYTLLSPKGNKSVSDAAEVLSVKDGKISSSSIFFDTAAFQAFMAQG